LKLSEFGDNPIRTNTPSAFIVYLGLNTNYEAVLKQRCSWWCTIDSYDTENIFSGLNREDRPYLNNFVFCIFSSSHDKSLAPANKETISLIVLAKHKDSSFWERNKDSIADDLINKAERFVPNLSKHIIIKEIATPLTLHNFTLNQNGASYGWESTVAQISSDTMPLITSIKGLFLASHWATSGIGQGGISTVAYNGRSAAKLIISEMK